MVRKVNHKELRTVIKHYYNLKPTPESLFIWGTFGIGKSRVIKDVAQELALEKNKEFIDWHKTTPEQKQELFSHPEKYFVLIDIRLSEYDSSDIKGLPDFQSSDKKSIEFRIPYWALFLQLPDSDGILDFDEINLATPLVISSCYKIIYDRVINDGKINNNWSIIGCGNKQDDRANTCDIPPPLRDRGGEVELVIPDIDAFTEWAVNNNINTQIIGFLNFKSSNLFKVDFDDEQKFTTSRGWERVSKLIKDIDNKDLETLSLIISSAISEGISKEFMAYWKLSTQIDLDEIIKNPKQISGITDIGTKFFITTAIADKYKDQKIKFVKIMEVSEVLDKNASPELVAYLWRLSSGMSKQFKKDWMGTKDSDEKLIEKYGKYIL
jgi:hypothetical protein